MLPVKSIAPVKSVVIKDSLFSEVSGAFHTLTFWHRLTRLASTLKHISDFKEVAPALVPPGEGGIRQAEPLVTTRHRTSSSPSILSIFFVSPFLRKLANYNWHLDADCNSDPASTLFPPTWQIQLLLKLLYYSHYSFFIMHIAPLTLTGIYEIRCNLFVFRMAKNKSYSVE